MCRVPTFAFGTERPWLLLLRLDRTSPRHRDPAATSAPLALEILFQPSRSLGANAESDRAFGEAAWNPYIL